MGRKRLDPKTAWMPPRVYRGKSAFEFHPKGGGCIRLCPLDAAKSVVWKEYEKHVNPVDGSSVNGLITQFFASAEFKKLSNNTRNDYQKNAANIVKVFGRMDVNKVEPHHVRKYMDKRGLKSTVQANREKSFFQRVYSWAYERGIAKANPCKGVRKFAEKARDRYITDEEYRLVWNKAPTHVRVAMEISYLCAARKTDVLQLRWSQVLDEGVYIQQGKTGKKQIKAWSPRLRAIIFAAKQLCKGNVSSAFVICQSNGRNYTGRGFDEGWMKARDEARKESGEPLDFTFHDLKAKGISDFEGSTKDKQRFSGHKTEAQVNTYDRKVEVVPSLNRKR